MSLLEELHKDDLLKIIGKDDYVIKTSSAQSLLLISKNRTIKVFQKSHSLTPEIQALQSINSPYVIDMKDYVNSRTRKVIIYETIIPLTKVKIDNETLLKMLCDVANGLYDIHAAGYTHGDVGIGNIGLNKKGNFVLYDFEDVKKGSTSVRMYQDVEMFLEDLKIQYKSHINFEKMIKALLDYLQDEYVTAKTVVRMFLGKEKKRTIRSYSYKLGDFRDLVDIKGFC